MVCDFKKLLFLEIAIPSRSEVLQPEVVGGWVELELQAQRQLHFGFQQLGLRVAVLAACQQHLYELFVVTVLLLVGYEQSGDCHELVL